MIPYINKNATDLDSRLCEANSQCQLFPHEDVRVVSLGETPLQLVQLARRESRPVAFLFDQFISVGRRIRKKSPGTLTVYRHRTTTSASDLNTMTQCIGKDGRPMRVLGPDYVHHYPTFKSVQLAAVKEKLYNPNLPTFRHEDRDNVMGKLCDEHCKTTSCCTPRDFAEAEMNALRPPVNKLHCLDVTRTGKALSRLYFTPQEVQKASMAWHEYVKQSSIVLPSLSKQMVQPISLHDIHFDGVALRVMKPETRNRRYFFKCEPQLDPSGYHQQQPTPYDINSRYRPAHPLYHRNMSDQVWLPTSLKAEHHDTLGH
ncbi:hypothetical protein Btru_076498 [Bulinus truncatus]|nr:hypothetical protein Btru_076498 [Bulinus truncatus]